jgi:hypothetical protein
MGGEITYLEAMTTTDIHEMLKLLDDPFNQALTTPRDLARIDEIVEFLDLPIGENTGRYFSTMEEIMQWLAIGTEYA